MARDEQQPMSDARQAEIREAAYSLSLHLAPDITGQDLVDLLAEVERLRAREAALVEVVRAVAEANVICNHYFDILDGYPHPPEHVDYLCPTAGHPKASTVRAQARALLASADEAK